MRINEIAQPKHNILTESCQGLTSEQRRIVEGIYNEFKPILEVALTPQQINQLFTATQQAATDAGGNRTLIGRGVDAASAVNRAIDNVGKWLQNTAPVQAFDQKFENLKGNIAQKFPQLGRAVSQLGDWAKANPGKTAAIVGVLTTIAALGAGPAGGAIAGQILRGTAELLKGEKLSTAIGKGVKTAALGYLSGKAIEKVGEFFANVRAEQIPYGPTEAGLQTVKLAGLEASGPGEYFRFPQSNFILADGFDARRLQYAFDAVKDNPTGRNIDELIQLAQLYSSNSYTQQLANIVKMHAKWPWPMIKHIKTY